MKRILVLLVFLINYSSSYSQRVIDVTQNDYAAANSFLTVSGEPVVLNTFTALVEGTPYFKDEWLKSSIVLSNGNIIKNIPARLNLLKNTVHYKDARDNEMIATVPVQEIVLYNVQQDVLYRFISNDHVSPTAKKGWYLWLLSGKASLYKYFEKQLSEQKPYGSATAEQHIKTKEKYLILYNNTLLQVSKIKDIPTVLANKKEALEQFIAQQLNRSLSQEDQFAAVVAYYNTLL